ncbi:ABC transporter permease [Photobacterium alginatilyticum]
MGALYLAYQYFRYHCVKTALLVTAITLVFWLPLTIQLLIDRTAEQLMARADQTPLVVGRHGSPLELVLNTLYFRSDTPAPMPYADVENLESMRLAEAIPLYVRFHSQQFPIVGTTLSYFDYRRHQFASGRSMALLGEAVIGAQVAESLGIGVGDSVISSPESVFDIAGIYPLKMPVVGVLKRSFGPDDKAIFTDIKTTWVIEGLGHGHQDLNQGSAVRQILKKDGDIIIANASVQNWNEITPDNIDSFHFHGDLRQLPISSVIPVPQSDKAAVLLQGRFAAPDLDNQIVRTQIVMQELLDTVFTVRNYVVIAVTVIGGATLLVAALVFMLSMRLRHNEVESLTRIGASRGQVTVLLAAEVVVVIVASSLLATALFICSQRFGVALLQQWLIA